MLTSQSLYGSIPLAKGGVKMRLSIEVKTDVFVHSDELAKFIYNAKIATYASGGDEVPEARAWIPGNKEYEYQDMGFYYRDSYCGYLRAPGREWVKIENENGLSVWSMAYDGGMLPPYDILTPENLVRAHRTFEFLKEALSAVPKGLPLRGPAIFSSSKFKGMNYLMTHGDEEKDDIARFAGWETITENSVPIFKQDIVGGIIVYK